MSSYPTINSGIEIYQYPQNEIIIHLTQDHKTHVKRNIIITEDAWMVLKHCNGVNDIDSIYNELQNDYDISMEYLTKFFGDMNNCGLISIKTYQSKPDYKIFGDGERYFPRHISFRITEKCNLKCSYCYMGEINKNELFVNFEIIEKILQKLKENHVHTMEITGGEPMLYPDIFNVIQYCINNFELTTILSNGVHFPIAIIEYLSDYKDKVFIQISVDGSNENITSIVRRIKNTFIKTVNTIKKLIYFNIPFKVAIVCTYENINDVEDMIILLKGLGVKKISLTFAEEIGNAIQKNTSSKTLFLDILEQYGENISMLVNKYSDILNVELKLMNEENLLQKRNCGAGSRSAVVDSKGDVFPCVMLNEYKTKMGNLFVDEYANIFNNSISSKIFRDFSLKSTEEKSCNQCDYMIYCTSCITKVFIANKKRLLNNLGLCDIAQKYNLKEILPL